MLTEESYEKIPHSNAASLDSQNQPIPKITKEILTSVTGNSTVCFVAGLTVISVTASEFPNSPSLLSPPYFTGSCCGAMYLKKVQRGQIKNHPNPEHKPNIKDKEITKF